VTVSAASRWVVARDFVTDGIEVRLAEDITAPLPEASISVERDVRAEALPAVLRGGASATVSGPNGSQVRVSAEFTATDDRLCVRASATRDGRPIWSQEWAVGDDPGQPRP
jgi:hypothetical protein